MGQRPPVFVFSGGLWEEGCARKWQLSISRFQPPQTEYTLQNNQPASLRSFADVGMGQNETRGPQVSVHCIYQDRPFWGYFIFDNRSHVSLGRPVGLSLPAPGPLEVTITEDQQLRLAEEASRGGCEGHRGEVFAVKIARAHAALEGWGGGKTQKLRL